MGRETASPMTKAVVILGGTVAIAVGSFAIAATVAHTSDGASSGAASTTKTVTATESGSGSASDQLQTAPSVDVSAPTLTRDIAAATYDVYQQSRDTKNTSGFTASTCQAFIDADITQRKVADVTALLNAYEQAKQYVPVQYIEQARVIAATGEAVVGSGAGSVTISAFITDNRIVPPRPGQQRSVDQPMSYEQGRWKFCPGIDPW